EKPTRSVLLQRAAQAFMSAESMESAFNEKPEADRTRAEYLKVINAYQRVYIITPHTGYADNALVAIARLYEAMHDDADAIRTLTFMIHEYPSTPFKESAEKDLIRLQGGIDQLQGGTAQPQGGATAKSVAVDNVRYWEAENSLRIVVDLS